MSTRVERVRNEGPRVGDRILDIMRERIEGGLGLRRAGDRKR